MVTHRNAIVNGSGEAIIGCKVDMVQQPTSSNPTDDNLLGPDSMPINPSRETQSPCPVATTLRVVACGAFLIFLSACGSLQWVGMHWIFEPTPFDPQRVLVDIPYVEDDPHPTKHRFDLYLPKGQGWPTLVFVHGGGWTEGDKSLRAGGFEIYGNIGAYYASRGIGVAVINYRLQPEFTWRQQVRDVSRAVVRIRRAVRQHGGDPQGMFLSGHSAGGQLAAFAAVADWPWVELGDELPLCGVVAVSGAGYDLADEETYRLGAEKDIYRARFDLADDAARDGGQKDKVQEKGGSEDWQEEASVVHHLDADDPPFLVFYAADEYPSLRHQAKVLHKSLQEAGVASRLAVVPKQGHRRIVLTLSQGDHQMTSQVEQFIAERHRQCHGAAAAGEEARR